MSNHTKELPGAMSTEDMMKMLLSLSKKLDPLITDHITNRKTASLGRGLEKKGSKVVKKDTPPGSRPEDMGGD